MDQSSSHFFSNSCARGQSLDKENFTAVNVDRQQREENKSFRSLDGFQSLSISKPSPYTSKFSQNGTSGFNRLLHDHHQQQERISLTPQRRCFSEGEFITRNDHDEHLPERIFNSKVLNQNRYNAGMRSASSGNIRSSQQQCNAQCNKLSPQEIVKQQLNLEEPTAARTRLDSDPVASILLLKELDEDDTFKKPMMSDDLRELFHPEQRSTLLRPKATKLILEERVN